LILAWRTKTEGDVGAREWIEVRILECKEALREQTQIYYEHHQQ